MGAEMSGLLSRWLTKHAQGGEFGPPQVGGTVSGAEESRTAAWPLNLSYPVRRGLTRREAWGAAVGPERASTIISSSEAYRRARPELFEGYYRDVNPDKEVKVAKAPLTTLLPSLTLVGSISTKGT
jgi:hypothetical protein